MVSQVRKIVILKVDTGVMYFRFFVSQTKKYFIFVPGNEIATMIKTFQTNLMKKFEDEISELQVEFRNLIFKSDTPCYFLVLPAEKGYAGEKYNLHLLCNGTNKSSPHFLEDGSGL